MVKIKQITEISILTLKFKVIWDSESDGGSFDLKTQEISIGCQTMDNNPEWTLMVINHELMEIVLVLLNARLPKPDETYLFYMPHSVFETAMMLFTEAQIKFLEP